MSDKNNLVYREQLDDNVIEMLSEDIGSNYSLRTENTRTIVSALNEVLGKDIIMNAIGEPLLTTDTFAEMGEKIKELSNAFRTKLLGLGVSVSNVDKMAVMIEKIGEIDLGVDVDELLQTYIDSLKQVLIENGVEVNGNETLAELIVKVDVTIIEKNGVIENLNNNNEENMNKIYEVLANKGLDLSGKDLSFEDILNILDSSNIDLSEVTQLVCGGEHVFILKNDGSVWACGYNEYGQLGINTSTEYIKIFIQVTTNINNDVKQIACGGKHTFILKNDGSVWSCGYNSGGQLGLGNTTNKTTFTQVTTNISDVKEIICGSNSSFILKNDGSLWACGFNGLGELGLGTSGSSANEKTFTQVTKNINNDVKEIVCGYQHTFIIKNDGSLWACGSNSTDGALGLNSPAGNYSEFKQVTININNDVKQVACGNEHAYILKNDGSVWCCGQNDYGQLGNDKTTTEKLIFEQVIGIDNVKQVACGENYTMIVKNDGTLWSTGNNTYYQLGLGTNDTTKAFTQVTTNINNDVKEVFCGNTHTYVIKNDGSVWACGYNVKGALGIGYVDNPKIFTETFTIVTR